jgi:threonylcarbamoyladenosine tRNA methylthiotransferase MtaB
MANSVAFYTLGCKLNFSESSTISRQMANAGFSVTDFQKGADLYVINTCSVTDHADKKCRKVVKEALKYNPEAKVVVIGCYAQLKPTEIAEIPGVSMVLGAAEKFNLPTHLESIKNSINPVVLNQNIKETNIFIPGFSQGERTRSFMKVQDGCDYFCAFCTIPLARGKSRSVSVAETVKSAEEVAKTGVKEVVLTGVNIGDFGADTEETFYDLIKALEQVNGIERFRISSIEPNLLSEEIIEFVAQSKKFVPHFHIPLQSGSNEILHRMRRKYQRELYEERVNIIKELMPHCCIGVDVITGFPGESEAHFLETYNFINGLNISYLHVFPYSERPNTTARKLDEKVPVKTRMERAAMLRILSEKKRQLFYSENIGKTYTVLYEAEEDQGKMYGFTENYIKIEAPYDPLLINELVSVQLLEINENRNVTALELSTCLHE